MPIASDDDVSYTDPLKRTQSADNAVRQYSETDSRPIFSALIKSTPARAGGQTWHTGGTDPNAPEHLTVEFKDQAGNHITTKHINRNGRAV